MADQLYQFVVLIIPTRCVEHQLSSIIGCIYVVLLVVDYIGRKFSDLNWYLTFGSRGNKIFHIIKMAEKINIKTPPTLLEDISYKNWKKETKVWQKFTFAEKEKQALAIFCLCKAKQENCY